MWEWKSEARVGVGLGTLLGPEASVAALHLVRGGGFAAGFCADSVGHLVWLVVLPPVC